MNNRPLYENLDTAFVNLSALIKYLRQREFVGRIRVELNSYEADIVLHEENKIGIREHDRISGRTAEGEEVFQRLLIRAREPGGTIHVYQAIKEEKKIEFVPEVVAETTNGHKPVEKAVAVATSTNGTAAKSAKVEEVPAKTATVHHPKFPFDLSNRMENKARLSQLSDQDWQILLGLTGELLGIIDRTLAEAKLDFKLAFSKARSEISADYPFLHPTAKIFEYADGKVIMHEQVSPKLFVASIIESLRRILDKLGANTKFSEVYRLTIQKILALISHRQSFYDKFSITPQLKKIVGV
ncbi:MAG: hypothetical protein AAB336_03895 [Acidobacteriota bacterium]